MVWQNNGFLGGVDDNGARNECMPVFTKDLFDQQHGLTCVFCSSVAEFTLTTQLLYFICKRRLHCLMQQALLSRLTVLIR